MQRWLGVMLATWLAAACSKPSTEAEAKQWPKDQPPSAKDVPIPAQLAITVVVDGKPMDNITADTLRRLKPDFTDADRKAWRISTLVTDANPPGSVEATSPTGVSVKFQHPTTDGLEPVLYLTRRGEVIVSALDPKDPFPRWHGEGGRLHRAGDPTPRVAPVSKIEIKRSTP